MSSCQYLCLILPVSFSANLLTSLHVNKVQFVELPPVVALAVVEQLVEQVFLPQVFSAEQVEEDEQQQQVEFEDLLDLFSSNKKDLKKQQVLVLVLVQIPLQRLQRLLLLLLVQNK